MGRLRELERLVAAGAITGYTVESEPRYLTAGVPVLTYSMYRDCPVSMRNLRLLAAELAAAGAHIQLVRRRGRWRWNGLLRRTRETTAVAWFPSERKLRRGVSMVRARYMAGARDSVAGSWELPDLRVCGAHSPDTIAVSAHLLPIGGIAAVVLDVAVEPPVAGMLTAVVSVLPLWLSHFAAGVTARVSGPEPGGR